MIIRTTLVTLTLVLLSACASHKPVSEFTAQDRALLLETKNLAEEAKQQSTLALSESRRALEKASKAADAANNSSNKADKIFRESQKK